MINRKLIKTILIEGVTKGTQALNATQAKWVDYIHYWIVTTNCSHVKLRVMKDYAYVHALDAVLDLICCLW